MSVFDVDTFARQLVGTRRASHHDGDALEAHVQRWALDTRLVDDESLASLAKIRCGSFAAHTYGDAPREVVELGACLIAWLYLFDDQVAEGHGLESVTALRARFVDYVFLLHLRVLPRDLSPFHAALLDLMHRASDLGATHEWRARFAASMSDYFDGCARELPYRMRGEPPSIADYVSIRSSSVGAYPVFDLIELGAGLTLSDAEARTLRPARQLAAQLCAWVNDIYSYPKERADGEPLNIVKVIEHERGCGPEDALDEVVQWYNRDVERLERMVAGDPVATACERTRAYLDGLRRWVHGNRQWTNMCGRYRGVSTS